MGQYWTAACPKCRIKFQPMPMKWREIAMSHVNLMKLGLFFMLHNGHGAWLFGDDWHDKAHAEAAKYREQPEQDFEEMREGVPYLPNTVLTPRKEVRTTKEH